jgi:hypothetical protein
MKRSVEVENDNYYLKCPLVEQQSDVFSKAIVSRICNSKKEKSF